MATQPQFSLMPDFALPAPALPMPIPSGPAQPTFNSPKYTYLTPPGQIRYGTPPMPKAPMRRRLTFENILVDAFDEMGIDDMDVDG